MRLTSVGLTVAKLKMFEKKDIFSRYILTPTKFNCTLEHAQILKQIPKKSRNFFLVGLL